MANAPAPELRAEYQANYDKAESAKKSREAAATKMFQFYTNLLAAGAKYEWNKIVN
jgi:hypothetical protein